jgi:hypothetical protein
MIFILGMDQFVLFQGTSLSKSLVTNITHMIPYTCMEQLVNFQVSRPGKSLVAYITYMFLAGHCSILMTVGWAWLSSRVCLVKKYWHWALFVFSTCLQNEINKMLFFKNEIP